MPELHLCLNHNRTHCKLELFHHKKERRAMPYKPKHPCAYPGCSELSTGQYCEKHKKRAQQLYNIYERDPIIKKKYKGAWKRIRDRYMAAHPLCEDCQKENKYIPAEEVHHVLPLSCGGTHDDSNLCALCRSCHNKRHIALGDRHVGYS